MGDVATMLDALRNPETWDLVSSGYDQYVMPTFDAFARHAADSIRLPAGARVLDVACGPGTATAVLARQGHSVCAVDFSPGMLERLRDKLRPGGTLAGCDVEVHQMDGQRLTLDDAQFDGALSMFGLMFFSDRARGFRELVRVLRPGARACVSSWLPAADVPAMTWLFGSLEVFRPDPQTPQPAPPVRLPVLEDPEVFKAEMEAAGFSDVHVEKVDAGEPFDGSLEEFWESMVKSAAPIALMRASMTDDQWEPLSRKAVEHLQRTKPADMKAFTMSAWLAVGRKPT